MILFYKILWKFLYSLTHHRDFIAFWVFKHQLFGNSSALLLSGKNSKSIHSILLNFFLNLSLILLKFIIHKNETKLRINPKLFLIYQEITLRSQQRQSIFLIRVFQTLNQWTRLVPNQLDTFPVSVKFNFAYICCLFCINYLFFLKTSS